MTWSRVFLITALTFTAYSFMLPSGFKTLDDQASIVGNPVIQDPRRWKELFAHGYFGDRSYYRPLTNVSYMVEYQLFGLEPFFYNLDNLLIHIANSLLVWILVGFLVGGEVGFAVGLLFAIHPIQWEAVANISGRAILLSTFFGLISFIAYIRERKWLAVGAFVLALLCKESSAVLPGVFFIYAWLNRKNVFRLWPYAVIIVGYLWLRQYLGITETFPWRNLSEHTLGLLTFMRSVITDLRLFIMPIDLHFDRSQKLFGSMWEAGALMTIFVWVTALFWLAISWRKWTALDRLNLGWFALCLLPVSQIVTTIGVQPGHISTAEHFLYLACIPVFIVMVCHFLKFRSAIVRAAGLGFCAFFFLTTIEQNIYASSELSMMRRSIQIQPHNARLQSSVGLIYALAGNFPQAQAHFLAAVNGDPMNARYQISFGKSICDQGRLQECLSIYSQIQASGKLKELLENNRKAAQVLLERHQP